MGCQTRCTYNKTYICTLMRTTEHLTIRLEEIFARKGIITIGRELASPTGDQRTIRQLALRTRISHSEALMVIRKMEGLGIVKLSQVGKAHVVSLNEDNYIWKRILKPVLDAEADIPEGPPILDEIVKWLRRRLRKEGSLVISATLYGELDEESARRLELYLFLKEGRDHAIGDSIRKAFYAKFDRGLGGLTASPTSFRAIMKVRKGAGKSTRYIVLAGKDPMTLIDAP